MLHGIISTMAPYGYLGLKFSHRTRGNMHGVCYSAVVVVVVLQFICTSVNGTDINLATVSTVSPPMVTVQPNVFMISTIDQNSTTENYTTGGASTVEYTTEDVSTEGYTSEDVTSVASYSTEISTQDLSTSVDNWSTDGTTMNYTTEASMTTDNSTDSTEPDYTSELTTFSEPTTDNSSVASSTEITTDGSTVELSSHSTDNSSWMTSPQTTERTSGTTVGGPPPPPRRNKVAIGVGTTFGIIGAVLIGVGITVGIRRRNRDRSTRYANLDSVRYENPTYDVTNEGFSLS